ncbi:THAP domain-containing protein 6 isoform X2 [Anabrus simplex]|uniref:THAP domain-containing protein 6 isoform X2 n=1 Tax=Anabrus simplex TaxID=316456 RepID=UPI0035A30A32
MVYCCVPFCKAQYGKYCGVSFHEIPSNDELREKWLDAISREGEQEGSRWIPGDRSHVCSLHFRNEDFKENCKRRMLKGEAVPSLFPAYPVPLQRSVRIKKKRRTSAQGTLFSTSFEEGSKASTEEVVFIKCEPGLSMDEEDSSNFGTNVELPQVKAEPGFENEIPGIIKEEQNNVGFVTMDDAVEFDENGGSLNTCAGSKAHPLPVGGSTGEESPTVSLACINRRLKGWPMDDEIRTMRLLAISTTM